MNIKKWLTKRWVLAMIVVLAGAGFLIYRSVHSGGDSVSYKTAQVTKGTLTTTVSGSGNVEVTNTASVSPSISGQVASIAVQVGDQVTKGQVLFKVINDDLDLAVDKAYASYLQAQQSLVDAQNKLTNAQSSQTTIEGNAQSTDAQKTEAAQQVASAANAIPIAEINVKTALSSYNQAKEDASDRTVKAPISGTIVTVSVKNGDQLGSSGAASGASSSSSSSSSSAAIVINDLSNMRASVSLNEVDAINVAAGQAVSMTFDAISDLTLTGKVASVSSVGSESSGVVTYPAVINFDTLDNRLKPAMSLTAVITLSVKQDVLMVPNAAIKTSGDTSYVLLMKDGTPQQQTVEVGDTNDSYTEIVSGLSEGDEVVTQTITSSTSSNSSNSSSSSESSLRGLTTGGATPPSSFGVGPGGM